MASILRAREMRDKNGRVVSSETQNPRTGEWMDNSKISRHAQQQRDSATIYNAMNAAKSTRAMPSGQQLTKSLDENQRRPGRVVQKTKKVSGHGGKF